MAETIQTNFYSSVASRARDRLTASPEFRDVTDVRVVVQPDLYSTFGNIVRVSFRLIGEQEITHLNISLDGLTHRMIGDQLVATAVEEVVRQTLRALREIMEPRNRRRAEEEMAQWNQRQDQRLRQQESQRRVARGQQPLEVDHTAFDEVPYRMFIDDASLPRQDTIRQMNEWLTSPLTNRVELRRETRTTTERVPLSTTGFTNTYVTTANNTASTQWNSNRIGTMQYVQPDSEAAMAVTVDNMKALLMEMLKNGLTINLSMDESDGEVSAEVEVLFEGELIASDSDSVQL